MIPGIKTLAQLVGVKPQIYVDNVVSLGGLCEVAYQLRRLARSERAYPFDWWITPLRCLPIILEQGADAAFEIRHIRKVPDYDGHEAIYSHLSHGEGRGGTIHPHEFSAKDKGFERPIEEISARLTEKYKFLQARLQQDVKRGRTLFVRQFLPGHDPEDPEKLASLIDSIEAHLASMAPDYGLLLIDYCEIPDRERVIQAKVERHKDANDLGSARGWTEMFKQMNISLRAGMGAKLGDLLETLPSEKNPAA